MVTTLLRRIREFFTAPIARCPKCAHEMVPIGWTAFLQCVNCGEKG
jgi:hypothetical protein